MDIVKVDVDRFTSAAVDPTSEIVPDNDEFETNADDEEDDEFTSSSDFGSENEFEGRGNPEDEDVEDSPQHPEETSTTGRGTLSHHATLTHPDVRYSLHYTHGWSHVTRPYPTYAPGPSSSHYTSLSPPNVYPHDHGIRPSSSHHATPSPSGHPARSLGAGDKHTSTSRRPPAPHHHSSARSSSSRLRSSIPQPLEEIPNFFRPPTAPADGENPLTYLIAKHGLYLKEGWKWEYVPQANEIYTGCIGRSVFFTWDLPMSFAICDALCRRASIRYMGNIYLIAKKRITPIHLTEEVFEHYKRMRAIDEAFKKKSEQMSRNRKSEVGGPGTGISLHSAGSISARQHGDTLVCAPVTFDMGVA
ncbi:hypothetical protein Syun_007097 [Stephania yunnanensis]|uniref:Uncharacterized protein n=1 Tax=Stephania yunnanensis TaxID=152371 RepID=A0AAP0KY68_9MAGN